MKKSICIVGYLLVTGIIYVYLCMIVSPKSIEDSGGTSYYRGMGFLAEPKNSIDVMVYGNSDVYSGFSPAKLFDDYGYTSYASGSALQTIDVVNDLLRKTLKVQKPKVVILDVDCLYQKMKFVDNTNFFLAPFNYHARWKELEWKDFCSFPDRSKKYDINKGYVYSDMVYKFENIGYMGRQDAKPLPVPRKNIRQLKHFIKTCRNNSIELLFIELPSATSWNYSKHNFIKKFAQMKDIKFIDFNVKQNSGFQIDYAKDFRDNGDHLNVTGAEKITEYIGQYLDVKYGTLLADRRNHNEYAHWQKVLDNYIENKTSIS